MKKSLLLATGGAIGYVMGARAGRERFETIKNQSESLRDRSQSLFGSAKTAAEKRWPEAASKIERETSAGGDSSTSSTDTADTWVDRTGSESTLRSKVS
jgi:hypothetical protein